MNYYRIYPYSVDELLSVVERGRLPWKRRLKEWWAKTMCALKGHVMSEDRWAHVANPNWREEGDYEIHLGCCRCPHLVTLPSSFEPESARAFL